MLGQDIAAALPALRSEAESRMTDTVTVALTADVTGEDGTAQHTAVVTRYEGKARIRWGSKEVTNAAGPDQPVAVQEPYLSIPWGTNRLHIGDDVRVTDSLDALLIGRRFRVAGAAAAGQVTAYRYPLEEIN